MDEVIVVRKCRFCEGFGVYAPKWQYEVWDSEFHLIVSAIASGKKNMSELRNFFKVIVILNLPCDFCNGTGETVKRIFPEKPCS